MFGGSPFTEIGNYCFVCRPGGGKSTALAYIARDLLNNEYPKTRKKYPTLPERYILPNFFLEPDFAEDHKKIIPWKKYSELKTCHRGEECFLTHRKLRNGEEIGWPHYVHDADIFIDEIAKFLNAKRDFNSIPEWFFDIFTMHRKRGLRIFSASQDYKGQVASDYRRMVKRLYYISNSFKSRDIAATMPPPENVHGIFWLKELDPIQVEAAFNGVNDEELDEIADSTWYNPFTWFGRFFFLTKNLIKWFDTQEEFPMQEYQLMEEYRKKCIKGDACADPRHGHQIYHRPI